MQDNPLLKPFTTPLGAIPFHDIKLAHYLPALKIAIADAKKRIDEIKNDPSPATFFNTVVASDAASERVGLVSEVYFNLLSAEADEKFHALAKEMSPLLAEFSNDLGLDEKLFARIKEAHDTRHTQKLSKEELRILEKNYKDFVRNGALLQPLDKEKLREIDKKLSQLGPEYSENLLKATNAFELWITDISQLKGLPDSALEAAAAAAEEKGKKGQWFFNLDAPSYIPLLTYCENEKLRETIAKALGTRSYKDAFDNEKNTREIAQLRFERAQLLGFKDHADYVLQERMAGHPERVRKFLDRIFEKSRPKAKEEINELKAFKKDLTGSDVFNAWDSAFYSEKLKQKKYSFDEELLRPYFKLENVIAGVFEHARRLYNLKFSPRDDLPVYHPDVKVFEVHDESSKELVGLFYADFFPRPTKKGGAWMTSFREQGLFEGEIRRPHIAIVCNFTKPTPTKPSLLSYGEVETLFHEFGHALHGLLSQCRYRSLSGTNVYWDFVELPSQIMENWVKEKESLDIFAKHFETGAALPEEYAQKIKDSAKFQVASFSLRQLMFGYLDFFWHEGDPSKIPTNLEEAEDKAIGALRLLPKIPGSVLSTSFSHIFAGGYSAGYYSYKWAEVLDADAFEFFKEKGLFNAEVAGLFKEHILSKGGTENPMDLYIKFRGREPDPDALLRREALL